MSKGYDWRTFPKPACPSGYPWFQIEEILDEQTFLEFKFWMRSQTITVCEGRRYNYSTREYEPDKCEKTPHGGVVYLWDLHRFLGFLSEHQRKFENDGR